jgi:beta-glucosidase
MGKIVFQSVFVLALLFSACSPLPAGTQAPEQATAAPSAGGALAPDGLAGETYYAPFPVAITLDGSLEDWQGVPTVTMPAMADLASGRPAVTFAAAADDQYLYLMGDVIDSNIIAGQHEDNYWNEDSIEFYLNGTGDLKLGSYADGVAQLTIPAANIGKSPAEVIIAGVNGTSVGAQAIVVETETGWAVEVAVPLQGRVWQITPAHGGVLGFQVHLNGASEANRDTKLIWSKFDASDKSYQDPSLFGQLIFYQAGSAEKPVVEFTPTPQPTATLPPPEADAAYRNAQLPVEQRVEDLLARMSLGEKFGQMTLVEKNSIADRDVKAFFVGGVLSGGGGYPNVNTAEHWANMVNRFQKAALETRLGIPILYGVDAVHGHNNLRGATIFPHNIGLGAANDERLMRRIGEVTAAEMIATGVYWDYAPAVPVVQDIRWGRSYESYGENTDLVSRLAVAYMRGLQGDDLSAPGSVLATYKHYVGDGGTKWGSSLGAGPIDQGVTDVDEATLRAVHLPPYQAGIQAGARSVMVSYSSWGGLKMHAQKYLVTDVLKGELGFTGFVVSDWGGVDQISNNYYDAMVASINAGVDMNMVPYNYKRFLSTLESAVQNGDIPMERIDDAVRRILRVKFEMGLFDHPYSDEALLAQVGSPEHRAVAREAVAKSLVLLKNDGNLLPLSKSTRVIHVSGQGADDIGMQSGGWTIEWQGKMGESTIGTTLLQGIQAAVRPGTTVEYEPLGKFTTRGDVCIAVVGETPYAEYQGDKADLALTATDVATVKRMRENCDKLVVILISGRPLIVTDQLPAWDAFVAAWLPGTEGQGVADALFGDMPFTGTLPVTWPGSMDYFDGVDDVLFPYGYGLTTR